MRATERLARVALGSTAPVLFIAAGMTTSASAIASMVTANTTSWINPRGGAWNETSNWSAGVPTAKDAVVLPALRLGDYVIEVPTDVSIASLAVDGAVTLAGTGSITTSNGADVGVGAASNGEVTLKGVALHVATLLRVGFGGGTGAVALADATTHVDSGLAFVGTAGTGLLDIASGASLSCGTLVFGAGSTLKVVVSPSMAPAIATANLTRGGALSVFFTDDVALPILTPITFLTASNGVVFGDFMTIETPAYYGGQQPPVIVDGSELATGYFNPIELMWIEPVSPGAYVGFVEQVNLRVKRISGYIQLQTMWTTWSVEPPEIAYVDGAGLHAVQPGSAALTASLPQYGTTLVTAKQLTVLTEAGQVYEAIDVGSNGEQTNGAIYGGFGANGIVTAVRCSVDGRYVVFADSSTTFGPDPSPGQPDVYVKDRVTGALELVSGDMAPDADKLDVDISADGRFVTFAVVPDPGESRLVQLWLHDRQLGLTTLVSRTPAGVPANGSSYNGRVSGDGSTIAFRSTATDLGPRDDNGVADIYAYDVVTGAITLLSVDASGVVAALDCDSPAISGDGRVVTFTSFSDFGQASPGYVSQPALRGDGSEAFFVGEPKTFMPFANDVTSDLFARTFGPVNSADLNRDGIVGPADLAILLGAWGTTGLGDLDADGIVGPTDIAVLLGAWTT